jgi:hypothetical protein
MTDSAQQLNDAVQWILNKDLPNQEKVLIVLLLRNGLRVSEICNPANIKKIDDWTVSVYCNKTKVYRTCTLAEASEIEKKYQVLADIAMWKRNRYYYYRMLKGLITDVETNREGNKAVTHAARNIRAQMTMAATGEIEAAAASIGHKSTKSTESYIKTKRRGAEALRGVKGEASGSIKGIQLTRTGVLRKSRQ